MVPKLSVPRLRSQLNRVLVVESSGHEDFPPGKLGDGGGAVKQTSASPHRTVTANDALDAGRQPDGRLVKLVVELVDQVDLPIQPFYLPYAKAEGKDRHQAD